MTRARELANFADNTAGLETLTVSDITDLSVSASNINSSVNQITDSSTDLNVDSNTLVVDKSENRVGINETSPSEKLTVASGNIQLKGATYTDFSDWWGVGNNSAFFTPYGFLGSSGAYAVSVYSNGYRNNSAGFTYIGSNNNTNTASGIDLYPTGEIQLKGGTASGTVLPTRLHINSSGNVGIGKTPASSVKLDVNGSYQGAGNIITSSGIIRSPDGSAALPSMQPGVDADTGFFRPANNTIGFSTAGTERMRIDSSGKVAIGHTGPIVNFGTNRTTLTLKGGASGDNYSVLEMYNNSADASDDNLGIISFGDFQADTSNASTENGRIACQRDSSGYDSGKLIFYTRDSNGSLTDRLTIYDHGDVQIPYGQIQGGIGARSTSGTQNWNHDSNAISGSGKVLLLGSHGNGPGGGSYYHPFTFEYSAKNGTGNMTQTAWGYNNNNRYMRWRYNGTWSSWYSF